MIRRKITVLLLVVFISLSLTGCIKKQQNQNGTLNARLLYDPISLDPAQAYDSDSMQVVTQVFDGLIDYNPKTLKIMPAVTQSWEINNAATKFTFYLKENTKFQNGDKVTADDFKYAWERVVNPKTASELSTQFSNIKGFEEVQNKKKTTLEGVKVIDDNTLEVTLTKPNADFIKMVGHPAFSPISKKEAEKDPKGFGEKPVGNGPFKITSWKRNEEVTTERFNDYYGDKPLLKKVIYKVIADDDTALKEFKAGNIDFTYIPVGQLNVLKKDKNYNLIISPLLATYSYSFDLTKKPWSNKKVREAFNYAVNRPEIIEKYAENQATEAYSWVPEGMPGYKEQVTNFSYNPEQAKKLLAGAGYAGGKGFPKKTFYYEEGLGHDTVAQIVQQNLKDIGINIQIQGLESGSFWDLVDKGKADFYKMTWAADYPTMDSFLAPLFATGSDYNTAGYSNKAFDKKLEEARAVKDEETRNKLYSEAESMLMGDSPLVPLFYQNNRYVVNKKVKKLEFSTLNGFFDSSKIWIEK